MIILLQDDCDIPGLGVIYGYNHGIIAPGSWDMGASTTMGI